MSTTRVTRLLARVKLLSGVSDAGFASLGTFLAGVVAVRELPAPALAFYVVLSSATIFTCGLPALATMISSPACARSMKCEKLVFASWTLTVVMA